MPHNSVMVLAADMTCYNIHSRVLPGAGAGRVGFGFTLIELLVVIAVIAVYVAGNTLQKIRATSNKEADA